MMRLLLILVSAIFLSLPWRLSAATPPAVYKITQLDSLQKIEPRKVVIFIYTDWCRYCRAMEHTTLKNGNVVKQLNEQFYFVALNAKEKADIIFQGQIFRYKPTGADEGLHQFALSLAGRDNELSFPFLCILNSKNEVIDRHSGFLRSPELTAILNKALMDDR